VLRFGGLSSSLGRAGAIEEAVAFGSLEEVAAQTIGPRRKRASRADDDASDDGSAERLAERYPLVSVLRLPRNLGLSAARNAGTH